jgi:hypothetical protein
MQGSSVASYEAAEFGGGRDDRIPVLGVAKLAILLATKRGPSLPALHFRR